MHIICAFKNTVAKSNDNGALVKLSLHNSQNANHYRSVCTYSYKPQY